MKIAASEILIIVDYGSQYTQLIARAARELGVYSEIVPYKTTAETIRSKRPHGLVLSGGPNSVYDEQAPQLDPDLLKLNVPVLGICYGMQLLALELGGQVSASAVREYGEAAISLKGQSQLLPQAAEGSTVWMSHGDHVTKVPAGFAVSAVSRGLIAAMEDPAAKRFGLQFHPEVSHSQAGLTVLKNFFDTCGFKHDWTPASVIEEQVESIRRTVGDRQVICALSGGVDSSVAATLVDRAIGAQQTCIFVDTGLLRQNEYEEVLAAYKRIGLRVTPVRAASRFYQKLAGVSSPETKRKIIGGEFIKIFEAEAKKLGQVDFLVQGTLYPDVIESVSLHGASVTIKSHHNVGGLPKRMKLKLIEPLRELFKDEVRAVGSALGLPESIVQRQPFPGPGLAIRILGEVTRLRIRLLQAADAIVRDEIERHAVRPGVWQFFAVLLPVKAVGVMGDGRTYEQVIAVRAVSSRDGMTADWSKLPHELLALISNRIISEVRGINRVVYDITSKPPGTIEWE